MKVDLGFGTEDHLPIGAGRGWGLAHGLQDFRRNRTVKELVRLRTVIADGSVCAGFVLHLHHQHRSFRISVLEVLHEGGEGALVRFEGCRGKRGRRVNQLSALIGHMGIALGIELHPFGHIVLAAVLPGAEPEQNQVNVVLAGLGEDGVHRRVIELPLLGLELLPVDRRFERVGMEVFDGGPHLGERGRPVAGVVRLRAQHQKRRAVHQQCIASILLDQAGYRALRGLSIELTGEECSPKCGQNSGSYFHPCHSPLQ